MSASRMVPAVDISPQLRVMPSEPAVTEPVPPLLSTMVRMSSPARPQPPLRKVLPSSPSVSPPPLPLSTWPELLQPMMDDYHEILNVLLNFDKNTLLFFNQKKKKKKKKS